MIWIVIAVAVAVSLGIIGLFVWAWIETGKNYQGFG
jgi:hypothetical protein